MPSSADAVVSVMIPSDNVVINAPSVFLKNLFFCHAVIIDFKYYPVYSCPGIEVLSSYIRINVTPPALLRNPDCILARCLCNTHNFTNIIKCAL